VTRILLAINDLPFLISHRLPILIALRNAGCHVAVAAPERLDECRQLREQGIDFFDWPLTRSSFRPVTEMHSVLRLVCIYRRWRPDLVHHVTPKPVLYGSIVARLLGVRCVINAISGLGTVFTNKRHGFKRRMFARGAMIGHYVAHSGQRTRVIFQNPDDQKLLVEQCGVAPSKVLLIPGSGVDPEYWKPAQSLVPCPRITIACRMLYDKGVGDLVEACRILRSQGVVFELELAGIPDPGNPQSIPIEVLQKWQTSGDATWLGHVHDMRAQWQRTRIACMPSYYGEGIPKTLIEAASCGLPIVTCDTPGCRVIVRDGHNGYLVAPRDPAALAKSLRLLLENVPLCERMGEVGRQRVIREFSLELVVRKHLDIYRELIGIR